MVPSDHGGPMPTLQGKISAIGYMKGLMEGVNTTT